MKKTPAQILTDFRAKLEELESKSLTVTDQYQRAKEKVIHPITACKLKHKPVDINIISSYPKTNLYIQQIAALQNEIVKLRNYYQNLLRSKGDNAAT